MAPQHRSARRESHPQSTTETRCRQIIAQGLTARGLTARANPATFDKNHRRAIITPTPQRVAVITGASSGIGKAAAALLLGAGWRVIAQGRDPTRTAAANADLAAACKDGARLDMLTADLSLMADTARLAQQITALTPRIDALLCNAGGIRAQQHITGEGFDATFAGNHLGHFLLVHRLFPLLAAAAAARVIATSSSGHQVSPPCDWSDPQMRASWESSPAYCRAKLYNILFIRELARRGAGHGIIAHAMHPGRVASNFASHGDPTLQSYMAANPSDPPEASAATLAYLAADAAPGRSSGLYWHDKAPVSPAPAALNDADAAQLWAISEAMLARVDQPVQSIVAPAANPSTD